MTWYSNNLFVCDALETRNGRVKSALGWIEYTELRIQ